MILGEQALNQNVFSMKNETKEYFAKLGFYEKRIENLVRRKGIIEEKCYGKCDIVKTKGDIKCMRMKGTDYINTIESEIIYDIESYVDTFFSALEHVLTLLFPFTDTFIQEKSYYYCFIKNTKWHWESKIQDVCGASMPDSITSDLHRIKEIYRNHNAHGGFSREMMAYVQIPKFGRYPMYIGKEYLKGFVDEFSDEITYEMYLDAKKTFSDFWNLLDKKYSIPMMFVRSGLPIPVDTQLYMDNINTADEAAWKIKKLWYDIDNQSNIDW